MRWIWSCTLLAYIAFLLGLIYTIIIDYDDKNPVKTICWILVVIFLPLLGISAYYIVGRNVSKKRSKFQFWREEFNRHQQSVSTNVETVPIHPDHYKELKSLILNLEQSPVFGGNKVTVYPGFRRYRLCRIAYSYLLLCYWRRPYRQRIKREDYQ